MLWRSTLTGAGVHMRSVGVDSYVCIYEPTVFSQVCTHCADRHKCVGGGTYSAGQSGPILGKDFCGVYVNIK